MYFQIKAFKNGQRRFENLDNIEELNEFVADYGHERGYNKFVVKSYDENGFRKRLFYIINAEGLLVKLN